MADLPQGIVTFVFTDVEGSTALWEAAPESMMDALRQHDAVIDDATREHGGVPVKPRGEGDSRFIVFASAGGAVAAAGDMQRGLAAVAWATPRPLRVRIAIHTGAADLQLGDYYGSAVNRAARLRSIAHGGQTVMSGSTWNLVRDQLPAEVTVLDMGEHRLKDLARPEAVYQITPAGLDEEFPPLASLDAVHNNLPVQLTDFVDRRTELEQVKRIVGESRLVTILAPGGAGKTRIAIQAAADLATDFPDGVFFIDLAPVNLPADVTQTVAEAIGVTLAGDQDLLTQLLAHLDHARRLLVFDNLEHLIDAASIVSEILRAAPAVKVIVTSRTKLNVAGETVFTLPGLEITWDTPEGAFRAGGVHLFIDAARRADASFTLSPGDLEPLGRILDHVGGLPLGILLAASWVDTLGVDEIAAEIARSMDFLESEMRDLPDRHRSVRAVFDYSWTMLNEEDRRLFASLSVFRGGFRRDAASEVAAASARGLANLVSKSLLVFDRETGRYSVHELLRQYAEQELRDDPALWEQSRSAHTAFYAARTAAAAEELFTFGDQKTALRLLDDDLDNIRSALRTALAGGNASEARRFLLGLAVEYEIQGWVRAGLDLFTEVGEAFGTDPAGEDAAVVHALAVANQAKLMTNLGHLGTAAPLAAEAVATLRATADRAAYVVALEALCEIRMFAGDIDEVLALSTEAIRVADEAGYGMWSAGMRNYQAFAVIPRGEIDRALRLLEEGEAALVRGGDQFMRTWNLEAQATIAMMQGRVRDAVELRNRQVAMARDVGYVRAIALSLQGLGAAHAAAGELDAAYRAYLDGLAMFEQMGLAPEMASVMVLAARVQAEAGEEEVAVEILACVLADPVSSQQLVAEQAEIREVATGILGDLERRLGGEAFGAAHRRGAAKSLDVGVKDLLTRTARPEELAPPADDAVG